MTMKITSKKSIIEKTGLTKAVLKRLIGDGRIRMSGDKILESETERIKNEMERFPSLLDFANTIKPENSLFDRSGLEKLAIMIDENDEIPREIMVSEKSVAIPYDTYAKYYIDSSMLTTRIKDIIIVWLSGYGRTESEKLNILLSSLEKRYPIFVNQMWLLIDSDPENHECIKAALSIADALQSVTKKDVPGWTTETLAAFSDSMYRYFQPSWKLWNIFQLQLQDEGYLRFARPVMIDMKQDTVSREESGYDTLTFALLMVYCYSTASIEKNRLIQKALDNPRYASLWLYVALHFVSAWRRHDYCRIPAPNIGLSATEISELYMNGDRSIFKQIANMTIYTVEQLKLKPNKTASYNPPNLKLYVAESMKETLGLIVAAITQHVKSGNPLIETTNFSGKDIKLFFGNEVYDLLGRKPFSNRKANKSLMQSVMLTGDEEHKMFSGYILAGLLRAHKYSYYDIPATTKHYLRSIETEQLSMDHVVGLLFERGVCGFAVQLLIELAYGDYGSQELSFIEMTELMSEIHISPFQAEKILIQKRETEAKATELITFMRTKHLSPNDVLSQLALGTGKSQDGGYCFGRVIAGRCLQPNRETCAHCNYEVLTTTMIIKLIAERAKILHRLKNETNELVIKRDRFLLRQVDDDLIEICTTAEILSEKEREETIADIVERGIECLP